ncbi:MAG: type II toxin-antitoxin system VapC family toxin [Burkholderiaceae bacterium]
MVIHLDTNYLIRALISGSDEDQQLRRWLADDEVIGISLVAWAEFLCGPLEPDDASLAAAIVGEALPVTSKHAALAASIFNETGRRRGSFVDCLIASVAIDEHARLATGNTKDFSRVPNLQLI